MHLASSVGQQAFRRSAPPHWAVCNSHAKQHICTRSQRLPLLKKQQVQNRPSPQTTARAAASSAGEGDGGDEQRRLSHSGASTSAQEQEPLQLKLAAGVLFAICLGASNRVLFKVALVPMANYVFFLAQLTNFGYLLVYFTALFTRKRLGIVTPQMLQIDKKPFILIGACEAASQVCSMIGASHLPGVLLPVVSQSYLLWSFILAAVILRAKFHPAQLLGALLVVSGVSMCALPPDFLASLLGMVNPSGSSAAAAAALPAVDVKYVALMAGSLSLPALASIIKEQVFKESEQRLGQPLDIFVVNSFGSLFQTLFVVLLLPVTTSLACVPLQQLPEYVARGSQCLAGLSPGCGADCSGSPLLPLAYVATNLLFNISMLMLLRSLGAVGTTIISSLLTPASILAFTLVPASLLPPPVLSPTFMLGACTLICGQLMFNVPRLKAALARPKPAP